MAIELKSKEDVEAWLNAIPNEERRRKAAIEFAIRTALRVMPLLDHRHWRSHRHLAAAWVGAKYSVNGSNIPGLSLSFTELSTDGDQAGLFASEAAISAAFVATLFTRSVTDSSSSNRRLPATAPAAPHYLTSFAVTTAATAGQKAYAAFTHAAANSARLWAALSNDATAIGTQGGGGCLNEPLWSRKAPNPLPDSWAERKNRQPHNQDWDVWIDWYEAVSLGQSPWPEVASAEIVMLPNDIWEQGPAVANKKIKEILARYRDSHESELPEPFDFAPQFGIGAQGEIVLEPSPPRPADPNKASDVHLVYAEVRSKNLELLNLGPNALGELNTNALELRERLPEEFDEANIYAIHSTTSSLRIKLKLHQDERAKPAADQNYAVMLDQTCAEYLSGLVGQLNIFLFLEARGRELDKVSLGPAERARALDELKAVAPAVTNIFKVASGAAVQVVNGNNNSAINAPQNILGDQAVDQGTKTNGNILTRLLRRANAIATWVASTAIGALVGELVITQWGVYGPAIVAFVKTHASQISRFLMSVYNNNPAIQKIIDFIVTNAPI
jgi:hypothetical protein